MNPDLWLSIVAALTGFVLKTGLAFGICLVFSRLVDSPNSRFMIWLGFLCGAAAYWLWLANGFVTGGAAAQSSAGGANISIQAVHPTAYAWQIPGSWAIPLGAALRALGIAYLLVLSYFLLAHIKRRRKLKWVLGFSSQPPIQLVETFQPLAESLHVRRSRLLVLPGGTSPATFGWLRPTVLLPDICLEQDRSDLEDILLHELHHVRRCDFFSNGIAVVCRALLFFHPAAWYALQKMQFDRELACDLAVISHSPGREASYAESLARFARLNLSQETRTWGVDFAASPANLKVRVHSILAGSKKPPVWFVCLRATCGLALLAGFLSTAPSLAVLLSYTYGETPQPQAAQPLTSATRGLPAPEAQRRTIRKTRFSPLTAPAKTGAELASVKKPEAAQISQSAPEPASSDAQHPSSAPTLVPGLIRRYLPPGAPGAPGNTRAPQQSVSLLSEGAGQEAKAGDNRAHSLQQSLIVAGGIYRRLADIKPDK